MTTSPRRRWLVREVVQTSAMDCGPATLQALLDGFGIHVSYGRLREACQTSVDGTSIDSLEEVACRLGLSAEQISIPPDHLFVPDARALPAIVVVRQPNGTTHFVLAWRRHGPLLQVMDPAVGRVWTTTRAFIESLYIHRMSVPAEAWREFAGTEEFLAPLRHRLAALGGPATARGALVEEALADPSATSLAALDATVRMLDRVLGSRALRPGPATLTTLRALWSRAREDPDAVPAPYWSAHPAPPDEEGVDQVILSGAVVLRAAGAREEIDLAALRDASPELAAALQTRSEGPGRTLLRLLREDGLLAPSALGSALFVAGGAVVVEALLLRGLLEVGQDLALGRQRLGAAVAMGVFLAAMLFVDLASTSGLLRMGRALEARLRLAFLAKIPRLGDRYFQSRLTSDMAERSHAIHQVRQLPPLGGQVLRAVFELGFTVLGIAVLDPRVAPIALLAAVGSMAFPLAVQPMLAERDLRVRVHAGALARFYLDALLGLVPVRTHGAQPAVRREHEALLVEWARAGLRLQRTVVATEGAQAALGFALAAVLLFAHLAHAGASGGVLLLVYWALAVPVLADRVAVVARQYPTHRNVTLRLLEPLGAPEEQDAPPGTGVPLPTGSLGVTLRGVDVVAAGQPILTGIDLDVPAGSHVAIVGPSGAGKSSLVGLFLGWHRPAAGQVIVGGHPLDAGLLRALRRRTAWVDPAVQLWNRSFLDNLRYGTPSAALPVGAVVEQADLVSVLERLPDGLQTALGESGGLLSGGEGQRVRLARALLRPDVGLALLDEPFRGLDRSKRRELLRRARALWADTTLLCVTHDVGETVQFPRVLVIDGGRIVEDGAPEELVDRADSLYARMLRAEEEVRSGLWSGPAWRRLWMDQGVLRERS